MGLFPRVLLLACGVLLPWLGGCASDPGAASAIRVVLDGVDGTWQLDGLELTLGERSDQARPQLELLVLVPDAWAGRSVQVGVRGMRAGQAIATGSGTAQVELGRAVATVVRLERVACGRWCAPGAMACGAEGPQTCEPAADGCMVFGPGEPCDGSTPQCAHGRCPVECVDGCDAPSCDGALLRGCGNSDFDPRVVGAARQDAVARRARLPGHEPAARSRPT